MAFPLVAGTDKSSGGSAANVTSTTITNPAGSSVGDLIYAVVQKDGNLGITVDASSLGWTEMSQTAQGAAVTLGIYYKTLDGSGDTLVLNHDSQGTSWIALRITGHDPSQVLEDADAGSGNANTSPWTGTPPTAPWGGSEDNLWVGCYAWDGDVDLTAFPGGLPDNHLSDRWASANGGGVAVMTDDDAVDTKANPGTGTLSATEQWRSRLVPIRPAPAGTLVQGTASLTASGSLTAAGKRTVKGQAAFSSTDTLTVAGKRTVKGVSMLDGGGVLTVLGTVAGGGTLVQGTASLASTSSLAATGKRTVKGQASLSGSNTLTVAGKRTVKAQVVLAGGASLVMVGKRTVIGSASLTSISSLSASGKRTVYGAVLLSGGGSLAALGSVLAEVLVSDVRLAHFDSGQAVSSFDVGAELVAFESGVESVAYGRNVRQAGYDSNVRVVDF